MKNRFLFFAFGLTTLAAMGFGQVKPWTPPRTPDGHPDLQGIWSNNSATPMERPLELAGRATLTDAEVAAMKKKAHELFSGDGDAAFGDSASLLTVPK